MADYLLGLYEKSMPGTLTIREKLTAAKENGFDFVELSIDETDKFLSRLEWTAEERQDVVKAMIEVGLPIRSICLSGHRKYPLGHPDPEIQKRSLEIMEGAIKLAADLGIRTIQIAGYDVYYIEGNAETRANFEKNLRKSVEMAAKEGVILAFETMETDFLNTVEKAMYWVNLINSPYLQVYPDVGNITNAAVAAGKNVLDDMRTGEGHIAAVDLKETVPGVFREVPYGTGHVDFEAVTKCAYEMGARRYLAEFWYVGNDDWKEIIRYNSNFLRSYLDKAAK